MIIYILSLSENSHENNKSNNEFCEERVSFF